MGKVTVCMEEIKKLQNPISDEIKSRGRSLSRLHHCYRFSRQAFGTTETHARLPIKAAAAGAVIPRKQTQLEYHLCFKMQSYLAEDMLILKKKKIQLERHICLKNALTFTQQSNN